MRPHSSTECTMRPPARRGTGSLAAVSGIAAVAGTLLAASAVASAAPPDRVTFAAHDHGACGCRLRPEDVPVVRARELAGVYDAEDDAVAGGATWIVPVAFHVVRRSDGSGGPSPEELEQSYDDLQAAFAGSGIEFCRPFGTDAILSDEYFETTTQSEIDDLREINAFAGVIDVYFVDRLATGGIELCGISSFTFSGGSQGIVVRSSCTASGGNASTLAHEVGHYFDLFHTHETALGVECPDASNCRNAGDLVCDTPADPQLGPGNVNAACQYVGAAADPCTTFGSGYDPDATNHMSYAPSACRTSFTPGQHARMRATLLNLRPELAHAECPTFSFVPDPRLDIVTLTPEGGISTGHNRDVSASDDGRFVVFTAETDDMAIGDDNGWADVILLDRQTGERQVISRRPDGTPSSFHSYRPRISADGRRVAFLTAARNLVDPDAAVGAVDDQAMLFDRDTGTLHHASRTTDGGWTTYRCDQLELSRDGGTVVYVSADSNLVEDDTQAPSQGRDVFAWDLETGLVVRASVATDGTEGNANVNFGGRIAVSGDGRFVAYSSFASNLVPGDTNNAADVFVRDRALGTLERASTGPGGLQASGGSTNPVLSHDGRFLSFVTGAPNVVPGDANGFAPDLVLIDRATGDRQFIGLLPDGTQASGGPIQPFMSPDGRRHGFISYSLDYGAGTIPGVGQAFVHDRVSGRTQLVSPRGDVPADPIFSIVQDVALVGDGTAAMFTSAGPDVWPNDLGQQTDVFVFRRVLPMEDVDGDDAITMQDLLGVLAAWGPCPDGFGTPCPADVDGSGTVDFTDLLAVLSEI